MTAIFKYSLGILALLLAILAGLLGTQMGSLWLLQQIPNLSVQGFTGQLGYQWQAEHIAWQSPELSIRLDQPEMRWQPHCLLQLTLCISRLAAETVDIQQSTSNASNTTEALVLPELPFQVSVDDLSLDQLRLNGQTYAQHTQAQAELRGTQGWPLSAKIQTQVPLTPDAPELVIQASLHGRLQDNLQLQLDTQGYGVAQLTGQLSPLSPTLPVMLQLTSQQLRLAPDAPNTLTLQDVKLLLEGNLEQGYQVHSTSQLGERAEVRLQLEGRLYETQFKLNRLSLRTDDKHYLNIQGTLGWQQAFSIQTEVMAENLPWQALYPQAQSPIKVPKLKAQLDYQQGKVQGDIQADLQGPAGAFSITTSIQGNEHRLELPNIQLTAGQGKAQGRIELDWASLVRWQLDLRVSQFNPAYWVAELPGRLEGQLQSEGSLQDGVPQGNLNVQLQGQLRNAPAQLKATAEMHVKGWALQGLNLSLGNNRIQGEIQQLDKKLQGTLQLKLNQLAQLWPELKGSAQGQLKLAGSLDTPQGSLELQGKSLGFQKNNIDSLQLEAQLSQALQGRLKLKAQGLNNQGEPLGNLSLSASGDPQQHRAELQLQGGKLLETQFQLTGQQQGGIWKGRISAADFNIAAKQKWALDQALALEWQSRSNTLTMGAHCWRANSASLCAQSQRLYPNPQARYQLSQFPLESLNPWLPEGLRWQGFVNASVNVDISSQGPTGSIQIDAGSGQLLLHDKKQWLTLPYQNLQFKAALRPQQTQGTLVFQSTALGKISAELQIDPQKRHKPLKGSFSLEGLNIALAKALAPQIDQIEGEINGQGLLTGTLEQPEVSGQLSLKNGAIKGSLLPITLERLHAQLTLQGQNLRLDSGWSSGKQGQATLTGSLNLEKAPRLNLSLQGQQLPITLPEYGTLYAAPQLQLSMLDNQVSVKGNLQIPSGSIHIRQLPPSTVQVSSDARIVGQPTAAEPTSPPLQMAMDVRVEVGQEKLSFQAFGLKADVTGSLRVADNLNTRGTLALKNGRYQAYGQNLTLRKAQLFFTGPLTQPFVDIEAIRRIEAENITAGVRLTGSATQPKTEIFAEPKLGQEQALSYLVTGHALGGGSNDRSALAKAALEMGLSSTSGLTSQLAKSLGIENFLLGTEESSGNTNLIASGHLSDKLSVRYGVSVFDTGNLLALRYQLTKQLFLEAASGLSSSLDLFYRHEF